MNRRDFTKLSTLAAASMRLPRVLAQSDAPAQKPVGYGVVGIGSISTAFMEACANSPTVKITALVTGHPETKGVQFSQMYGIPKSSIYTYEAFDRIRENKDVEALYIGLPNSMHCEYTVRGAQAGKHVLCEKPMAISSAECRTMIDTCRKADRKLMIAYRMQYDPVWQQAYEIVQFRSAREGAVVPRKHASISGAWVAADEAVWRRWSNDGPRCLSAERHPLPYAGGALGVYRGGRHPRQGRPALQGGGAVGRSGR
jgi:predicted dehydrogenase